MSEEKLFTVLQVAERLQVHPETVTRWIRQGRLPAILLSRRAGYRVRESDFQQFLLQRQRDIGTVKEGRGSQH